MKTLASPPDSVRIEVPPTQRPPLPGDGPRSFATAVADRYRIDHEVGRGGWGLVYRALDLRENREVAIKLLRPEYAGSVSSERFRREIEILSRLNHPHIVGLLDWGEFDGAPWYVMPYLGDETVRSRLDREEQLAIGEALRITREVAEALAHAHASDVVHRDIKPGNILLQDGKVLVADFGIARAITNSATSQFVSSSGVLIGTPAYMSPEQASAKREIDGRSDIYSLGCVLYEMLAGEPPFSGSSATVVTARHVLDPVPPVTTARSSVSDAVAEVVYRMLAKAPADRYASAADLVAALERVEKDPSVPVTVDRRRVRQWRRASVALAAGVALSVGAWRAYGAWDAAALAKLVAASDTTLVAIIPNASDSATAMLAAPRMREAIVRMTGVRAVDIASVTEAVGDRAFSSLTSSDARLVALHEGAGRYLRPTVTRDGSALKVQVALYDVRNPNEPIVESSERVNDARAGGDSAMSRLVDRLLLRVADDSTAMLAGRSSNLPARQSFLAGRRAMERWQLADADSSFARALQFDEKFAGGSLWLALARVWAVKDSSTWRNPLAAAEGGRASLDASEQVMLDALVAQRADDRPRACQLWDTLTRSSPFAFEGWYGAAECLARDRLVRPDSRSVSGWSFRSGYHTALQRYRRAFELRPAVLASLRNSEFARVRWMLWTNGNDVKAGRSAPPMREAYVALPSWDHDTLAFVPFPQDAFSRADPSVLSRMPRTIGVAAREQRKLFRDIASGWVASQPSSAEALEALAISLSLLGEPSAIDTLRRAAALASPAARQRIVAMEVWLRVQTAISGDMSGLKVARALADSLLRVTGSDPADPRTLASVAALTGHALAAERISEQTTPASVDGVSPAVATLSRKLVLHSAFGGSRDSLRALERRADSLIRNSVPPNRQDQVRLAAYGRAAVLSFPDVLTTLTNAPPSNLYLLNAFAALHRGDTTSVRGTLARLGASREAFDPPEITADAFLPEAWLLVVAGDSRQAAIGLDRVLARLQTASSLSDPVRAAMLVRAMAFRAELAMRLGDAPTASKWAGAVVTLWSGGDAFVQPVVDKMRQLMSQH